MEKALWRDPGAWRGHKLISLISAKGAEDGPVMNVDSVVAREMAGAGPRQRDGRSKGGGDKRRDGRGDRDRMV
jgi:hypothetical protein